MMDGIEQSIRLGWEGDGRCEKSGRLSWLIYGEWEQGLWPDPLLQCKKLRL